MQEAERVARLEEVIQPILSDHGLELVDLEWRDGPRGVLKLAVDKPGGVAVGDCERASREIGDVLDVAGFVGAGYDLEVSSPGLDRRLRSDREFRWAIGKRVRCWQSGGAETQGRLSEVSGEQLVLEHEGQRIEIPRATLTKARLDAELPWPRRAL
jgi:ribosome maturation factor RimP